ncbi:MAG: 2OG-Fe(II) oxygenase family protein, partial [Betaproteobacteria bacterium]|nr:2OG-Fe(II) oxygenase family protein [Betaproteobacteria bacterium]
MITTWDAIFPTPILRTNIGRELTEEEHRFFSETEKNLSSNFENSTSIDKYVLDAPAMQPLRAFFIEGVNQYGRKIISVSERVEFYITQSWINYTQTGQSHHRHMHTNSLISGVFYIKAVKDIDRLFFYRDATPQISVWNKEVNWYNADSWCFSVGTGDLILFPSNVQHGVEETA